VTEPTGATVPIPYPPRRLLLGNLPEVANDKPLQSEMDLARRYGSIFELQILNRHMVIVSSQALVNEVCDETRFDKQVWSPLQHVRAFAGDGLFTAWTQEPNWRKAHNILLPNFSTRAMQGYMPQMIDIARQLMDKWARLNPDDEIDVPADMTRLTLDTIGLCGFNYRFNSFYREEAHPFIVAIVRALGEALEQGRRLPVQERLMVLHRRQFQEDISTMNRLVDQIIRERRATQAPDDKPGDLLGYMLAGKDKQTGEGLDDLNIRYQIITFLIAGHETTSGLLSFAIYYLLNHPAVLQKAYAEVDRVLGTDLDVMPAYAQVHQLAYVRQILNESLRLWPTAPAFALYPYQPTVIGGKYAIDKTQTVQVLIPMLHRDKTVWGDDAEEFNPDHFSPEREQALPPNAFKPFGNGQRACIGRQFAMQEAMLVLGMLLQRFEFIDHTHYQLDVKETLTLKPAHFHIKIRPRPRPATVAASAASAGAPVAAAAPAAEPEPPPAGTTALHNTSLLVLYGSNLGTAEDLAREIAVDGTQRGFRTVVAPLDDYAGKLPTEGAVTIVTSSYNGTPPDNAGRFYDWLKGGALAPDALNGVHYSVFGCGNRDWAATYQAIPKFIDAELAAHGAERIHPRGEGDARDDFDGQFRAWYGPLWSDVATALQLATSEAPEAAQSHRYEVEVVTEEAAAPLAAAYGAVPMAVRENRELQQGEGTHPPERSTRHIAVALPEGVTYRTGDYLGVLPRNGAALVRRVAEHFKLREDSLIRIRSNAAAKSALPLDQPVAVGALLRDYVELQDVATRSQIAVLAAYNPCPPEQQQLLALSSDDPANVGRYRDSILAGRVSVIDLLETFPATELPFNIYLELLTPLRPRFYSMSSSPLIDPRATSVTVALVSGPARSGHGEYRGVCSSYLAAQPAGGHIMAFVRQPNTPFRMPANPQTPLIMVGPGTGLAPFRGFLQERAALKAQGRELGPAILFFGCRDPAVDFIYRDELEGRQREGITDLAVAFSRVPGRPREYVQDKIKERADDVWRLLEAGGAIYICGDASKMAPDVRRAVATIYMSKTGAGEPAAEAWLNDLAAAHRYVADVWAG
jgi:cytochrome P450/NADPH-cytochrome P450 reductase